VSKRSLSNEAKCWTRLSLLAILLVIAGCAKKPAPEPPVAPPPPPPAPTASISANPSAVNRGETARLTWRTENAGEVEIEGIGAVDPSGSRDVQPTDSTTYRLIAKGPGGSQDATTRVTVNVPPPPPVQQQEPTVSDEQWLAQNAQDIYFDYDSSAIRPDQQGNVANAARALQQRAHLNFTIEGHADERGSTEYNLTLGDERAQAVRNALVAAGVNASRINVISYGKEKPQCTQSGESCWQRNRRAHFTLR
jgi:peptidoglycan-associated lipoprotein